ncbi:MAG: helicase, partial [Sphingobacteriia bacterium]|nr:helicase [Sphingobacteriia bacterium]
MFFDANKRPAARITVASLDPEMTMLPALGLELPRDMREAWDLGETGIETSEPTITRPVTGDQRVHVAHNGRKIVLGFRCGFTEAKVRNAVLRARLVPTGIEGHRYPRGVRYTGQGALDLEVHLIQDDPLASFRDLVALIRSVGADPQVDPGLERYLAKRARRADVECTPYRHTVFVKGDASGGAATLRATARKTHLVEPQQWGSPVIKAGSEIAFEMTTQGDYRYSIGGRDFTIPADALDQCFMVSSRPEGDRWVTVHAGRLEAFPQRCADLKRKAQALGIDRFLTWGYQFDDLIELSMAPHGIAAWAVGLGKARLAVALVLL